MVYNIIGGANVYPANGAVVDIELVNSHYIRGPNSKYAVSAAIGYTNVENRLNELAGDPVRANPYSSSARRP